MRCGKVTGFRFLVRMDVQSSRRWDRPIHSGLGNRTRDRAERTERVSGGWIWWKESSFALRIDQGKRISHMVSFNNPEIVWKTTHVLNIMGYCGGLVGRTILRVSLTELCDRIPSTTSCATYRLAWKPSYEVWRENCALYWLHGFFDDGGVVYLRTACSKSSRG